MLFSLPDRASLDEREPVREWCVLICREARMVLNPQRLNTLNPLRVGTSPPGEAC
jgi:hypothetical protein